MEPVIRITPSEDWITLIIFTSILFVVISKNLFYNRFMNFIILPFNNKYVFMYSKKDRLLNWFHTLLSVFQLLNFALFIYLAQNILFPQTLVSSPNIYIIILGLLALFMVIKIFLQLGNGFVFNNGKLISEFIFKKWSYLNYSGIIMFLANVTLCYILKDSKPVVLIASFLILAIYAIGWMTIIKHHQKFISAHFFYFILYLCALEIAPFIIIANYLKY